MIKDYLYDRREGFVNRWHTEPVLHKESLAEHQFFVTRNTLIICQALAFFQIAYVDMSLAMQIALHHDEVEKIVGDMPGTAKKDYPLLKETMNTVERYATYDHIHNVVGIVFARKFLEFPTDIEQSVELQIVKYADVLDAHLHARTEAKMGNSLLNVAIDRTAEWMHAMQWPWLMKLRAQLDIP